MGRQVGVRSVMAVSSPASCAMVALRSGFGGRGFRIL